jgi:hypothetical protein
MTDLQASMIAEARRRHGEIEPCAFRNSLAECFTDEGEYGLLFWYNDAQGHTHVVRRSPACTG